MAVSGSVNAILCLKGYICLLAPIAVLLSARSLIIVGLCAAAVTT